MKTKKIVISSLLIAMGLLLPQAFHIFGTTVGRALSPMHIPVFIGGLFLGPLYGAIIGVIVPLLSYLITGMPPMPMVIFMTFELLAYGLFSGIFMIVFKEIKLKLYISLVLSMLGGRFVYFCILFVSSKLFEINQPPATSIFVTLTTFLGILAIIVHLVFVPPIVMVLQRLNVVE